MNFYGCIVPPLRDCEVGKIFFHKKLAIVPRFTSNFFFKTDPKKVPSQIFFLLVPLGKIAQLFTKKNPTSQSL